MINNSKISVTITLILLMSLHNLFGQGFTKNTLKLGTGPGASMGVNNDGLGINFSIGYQREVWKDRLRLNPNFSIGSYSSRFVMDARDQHFNSINLESNLSYDLIRVNTFSIVIGTGLILNNSRGLLGTGGKEDYTDPNPVSSEYFSHYRIGGYLGAGFRINSPNKRTAISIMPLNLHFGNNFLEQHVRVEVDIKFKR
jgi:hypothetical protein